MRWGREEQLSTRNTGTISPLRKAAARVAVYARYSTDKQDARSIDDQVRRCRGFAANRGFEVVATFSDAAISGSHMEREQLQKLLSDADRRKFDCVLVDDLSRLSRDLGGTWRIVFEDLASRGVRVIDCTTGIASDAVGGRLTFGALALVNDTFLQMVRAETHRGLEGRALAGFATGGKTFGFKTIIEPNPPDPTHPRKVRVKAEEESAVVLRIFEMYAAGASYKHIAAALNEDGSRTARRREGLQEGSRLESFDGAPHAAERAVRRRMGLEQRPVAPDSGHEPLSSDLAA